MVLQKKVKEAQIWKPRVVALKDFVNKKLASSVKVPVKYLLEHTIDRLIVASKEKLQQIFSSRKFNSINTHFYMSYAWDGGNLVASSFNYLIWKTEEDEHIFLNDTPGSIRFNRLISLNYERESEELSLKIFKEFKKI